MGLIRKPSQSSLEMKFGFEVWICDRNQVSSAPRTVSWSLSTRARGWACLRLLVLVLLELELVALARNLWGRKSASVSRCI